MFERWCDLFLGRGGSRVENSGVGFGLEELFVAAVAALG